MLCKVCKKGPPSKGRVRCILCIDAGKQRTKKYEARKLSEGLCTICGKSAATCGKRCPDCADRKTAAAIARRKACLEKGLCYQCGKRPHRPDRKTCAICGLETRNRSKSK